MKVHPRLNEKGKSVKLIEPHTPTPLWTWGDSNAAAIVTPDGEMPDTLCGIPVKGWGNLLGDDSSEWHALAERSHIDEPAFSPPSDLKHAAGAVLIEPDGRVWIVAPSNGFGGYKATFPKGGVDSGLSLQAAALREVYEESGLQAELTGHLIDVPRSTSYTRYYLGRRVSGNPAQMGWESQAVMLVPREQLSKFLNSPNDEPIIQAIMELELHSTLSRCPVEPPAARTQLQAVRHGGGNLVRVLQALDGFFARHRCWPSVISLYADCLVALATHHLTPFGFFLLQSKVELRVIPDVAIIAQDDAGRTFDYGREGGTVKNDGIPARVWLGFGEHL